MHVGVFGARSRSGFGCFFFCRRGARADVDERIDESFDDCGVVGFFGWLSVSCVCVLRV